MRKNLFVYVVAVLAAVPAFAVEIPGVSFTVSPEAHLIWALLSSGTFAAIVAAIGKIVQSIIGNI